MSFYETPVKRMLVLRACGCIAVAIAMTAMLCAGSTDSEGKVIIAVIVGFCLVGAAYNIWLSRRTPVSSMVTAIPDRASVPAQIRYYRRVFWISVIVVPIISVWVAYDLSRLESGEVASVKLWAPIVVIYTNLGYWPALLSAPILGCLSAWISRNKIRKLCTEQDLRGPS